MKTVTEFLATAKALLERCAMDPLQVRKRGENGRKSVFGWGQFGMPLSTYRGLEPFYVTDTPLPGMITPRAQELTYDYAVRYAASHAGGSLAYLIEDYVDREITSPTNQCFCFDCTGLVQACLMGWTGDSDYLAGCNRTGVTWRDNVSDMMTKCHVDAEATRDATEWSNMRPGSIVFQKATRGKPYNHVCIYLGKYPVGGALQNKDWFLEAAYQFETGMVNGVQQVFFSEYYRDASNNVIGIKTLPANANGFLDTSATARHWTQFGEHEDIIYDDTHDYSGKQVQNLKFNAITNTLSWDRFEDANLYEITYTYITGGGGTGYITIDGDVTSYTFDSPVPLQMFTMRAGYIPTGALYPSTWTYASKSVIAYKIEDCGIPVFDWTTGKMSWKNLANCYTYTVYLARMDGTSGAVVVDRPAAEIEREFGPVSPGDTLTYKADAHDNYYGSVWNGVLTIPEKPLVPDPPKKIEKSKIILYPQNERDFASYGECDLSDAMECLVKETRNGEYYLEMSYPATGEKSKLLKRRKIIYCKPNPYDEEEPFRIVSIKKSSSGKKTIKAFHISYDLGGWACRPPEEPTQRKLTYEQFLSIISGEVSGAIVETEQSGEAYAKARYPFKVISNVDPESEYWADIHTKGFEFKHPENVRALLCGNTGSFLVGWKGELKFKRWRVYHYENRGKAANFVIRYKKNIKSIDASESSDSSYEAIMPYAEYVYDTEGHTKISWAKRSPPIFPVRQGVNPNAVDFSRVYMLDLSGEDVDRTKDLDRTGTVKDEWLENKAEEFIEKNNFRERLESGTQDFEVDFQQLNIENSEYADYRMLETISLCDTVWVYYPELDIKAMKKVTEATYDVLRNRYTKLKLTEGIDATGIASDAFTKNMISDTSNVTTSMVSKMIEKSVTKSKVVSGYFSNGLFYKERGGTDPIEADPQSIYIDLNEYVAYVYNAKVELYQKIGTENSVLLVFGYYNSVTGKFYKESTYATEIPGKVDVLYIDKATRAQYLFDGTTFVKSSGTDVYFGYYNETDGKFYKETTFVTELPRLVNSAIYVDITSNTSYRLNVNEVFEKIGATSLVFAYKNGGNWYSDAAHTTQIQTNKTTLYIDIHTHKAMIDIGAGSTTVFDRILAKVPLQQSDFLTYDDDTEALKLLYTSAFKKTTVVNPDDPEDILYKLDLNVLANGGLVVASDGLKVEWDKIPLDSTSLIFNDQTNKLGVKLKPNAGLLATANGLDVNWNRIDWTAFPHDAESIGYDGDAAGYYVDWGGLPYDGTLQWTNNKFGVKVVQNGGVVASTSGLTVNWSKIPWKNQRLGIPIDGETIFWNENNVLEAAGGGGRTYYSGSGIDISDGIISVNLRSEDGYLKFVDDDTCLDVDITALSSVFATTTALNELAEEVGGYSTRISALESNYDDLSHDLDVLSGAFSTLQTDYALLSATRGISSGKDSQYNKYYYVDWEALPVDGNTIKWGEDESGNPCLYAPAGNPYQAGDGIAFDVTPTVTTIYADLASGGGLSASDGLAVDWSYFPCYNGLRYVAGHWYVQWYDLPIATPLAGGYLCWNEDSLLDVDTSELGQLFARVQHTHPQYALADHTHSQYATTIALTTLEQVVDGHTDNIASLTENVIGLSTDLDNLGYKVQEECSKVGHTHDLRYPQFTGVKVIDNRTDSGDRISLEIDEVNHKLVLTITDP